MTTPTPSHADIRPYGGMRCLVGIASGLLSLVFNFVVFATAAFSNDVKPAIAVVAVELVMVPTLGWWAARARSSSARNAVLAGCVGVATGTLVWVILVLVLLIFNR